MTALMFFTEASGRVWRGGWGAAFREQLLRGRLTHIRLGDVARDWLSPGISGLEFTLSD